MESRATHSNAAKCLSQNACSQRHVLPPNTRECCKREGSGRFPTFEAQEQSQLLEARSSSLKPIKVVQWNCEGAKAALEATPLSDWDTFDIIILTETLSLSPFNLPGFVGYHCQATKHSGRGRLSGGVSILVRPKIPKLQLSLSEDNTVILSSSNLLLVAMYSSPREDTNTLLNKLATVSSYRENDQIVILAGDLNCRIDKLRHREPKQPLAYLMNLAFVSTTIPMSQPTIALEEDHHVLTYSPRILLRRITFHSWDR